MPEEPGSWEATWFREGRSGVSRVSRRCGLVRLQHLHRAVGAGDLRGLRLARRRARVCRRAQRHWQRRTKWLAAGVVAAVRSGAFSLSSNRVDPTGACGGGGWIIDPAGEVLAITSAAEPFATRDIDLTKAAKAKESYPRYVFSKSRA